MFPPGLGRKLPDHQSPELFWLPLFSWAKASDPRWLLQLRPWYPHSSQQGEEGRRWMHLHL